MTVRSLKGVFSSPKGMCSPLKKAWIPLLASMRHWYGWAATAEIQRRKVAAARPASDPMGVDFARMACGRTVKIRCCAPRRIHPLEASAHPGQSQTLGRTPHSVTLHRTPPPDARRRQLRVKSVPIERPARPPPKTIHPPQSAPAVSLSRPAASAAGRMTPLMD